MLAILVSLALLIVLTFRKINIVVVGIAVPSRFMRKIVCRLRLNEVSRQ